MSVLTKNMQRITPYLFFDDPAEVYAVICKPSLGVLGEWHLEAKIDSPPQEMVDKILEYWGNSTLLKVEFPHKGQTWRGEGWVIKVDIIGPRKIIHDKDRGVDMTFIFQGTKEVKPV